MIPQIASISKGEVQEYRQPSITYRVNETNVDGKIDNIESVKQAIKHILLTERYSNPIYDNDYGVELEQYIGKDIGLIIADIETTLNEALTQDDRIISVTVDDVTQENGDSCKVIFTANTIFGDIKETLNVQR